MKDRLIFLDFDGVLNDPYWLTKVWSLSHKADFFELDPVRVELLSQVCYTTKAKLVLSSSWNIRDGVEDYFKKLHFDVAGKLGWFNDRGRAIRKWLDENYFRKDGYDYIILDDEKSDYSEEQLEHLILTSPGYQAWTIDTIDQAPQLVGLNEKHIEQIKERWYD